MSFKIIEIIDNNTIRVEPKWKWNDTTSDKVRWIFDDEKIILNKDVELLNPIRISNDILYCTVQLK